MESSEGLNGLLRIDRVLLILRSHVVDRLRAAIVEGVFRPGDRLTERALCEQLDVSRPLLREAIRQLESEGLLEAVPHRGPVVKRLTQAEATEIFDLCAVVEGLCARYFAQRGSAEHVDRLEHALDGLESALLTGDADQARRAKHVYYEAFVAGSLSTLLQTTIRQLNARLSQYWSYSQRQPERISAGIAELRATVQAIRARDAEAANANAMTYVRHASEYVHSVLKEEATPVAEAAPAKKKPGRPKGSPTARDKRKEKS